MKRKICKRADAQKAGHPRYFTGVACKHGHIAERLVRDGSCIECRRGWRAAFHQASKDIQNQKRADRYMKNRDAELERKAAYNAETRGLRTATENVRRARKRNALPGWFGEFDEFVMKHAYDLAKLREAATGIGWDVDHMIPLQCRYASGLHVGLNMQVIPRKLNNWKNNRMVMTEPVEWLRRL